MYLHLGQDVVVRQQDIVGVFDMDNTTISRFTRSFLNKAEKNACVSYVSMELPKSFIVCCPPQAAGKKGCRDKNAMQHRIYLSQISPRTLNKRTKLTDTPSNR